MQEQDFNRPNSGPERMAENQTPDAKPEAGSARPDDAALSLQEQLKKAELEANEHRDAWLRAKAEAENIRKRAQTDVGNAHKYAIENFAVELLAIKDSLEATLSAESASLESLKEGVELTLKQLGSIFEKFKLSEIHPVGEKFDPHKHQAITTVESEQPPNTVVHVLQKGYQLHDRVIRPALVTVATAKPSE